MEIYAPIGISSLEYSVRTYLEFLDKPNSDY